MLESYLSSIKDKTNDEGYSVLEKLFGLERAQDNSDRSRSRLLACSVSGNGHYEHPDG